LGTTHPPIQWVLGFLPGGKAASVCEAGNIKLQDLQQANLP